MVGHLMNAGHEVSVFSRTAAKCAPLVERGAFPAATPAEASCNADVVFTMVGTPIDVETVILGDQGVLSALDPGAVVVDCTTSTPSLAVQVAAWAAAQGAHSLDAPVSGGDVGAEAGTLSIMCGGSEVAMSKTLPLLELMGRPRRMGGPGAGQHTKMANQVAGVNHTQPHLSPAPQPASSPIASQPIPSRRSLPAPT